MMDGYDLPEGEAIFRRLVGLMGLAVVVTMVGWFVITSANDKRLEYNAFLDKALYEYGVLINYIYTSKFSRDDRASEFRVAIDDAVPEAFARHIRVVYEFLAKVSGRSVGFDVVSDNVFDQSDHYVYVGREPVSANPHSQQNPFVEKLGPSLERLFPNKSHDLFWKYQNASLGQFDGTPLFFNSEFASIDYDAVINGNRKYRPENTDIEKTAVYINIPQMEGASPAEMEKFIKYVTTQEIYQEYNLAADMFDHRFRLQTILYDYDDELGDLVGAERMRQRNKNVSLGLCPYDVMLTYHLYRGEHGNSPEALDMVAFIDLYAKAYWYYLTYPSELFDSKCW
ncbi:hypothetical protein [Rhizobium sullae]|uniref:hypothetical protein n=1 Tax=Rhizobium sullae TaxID=50338 RepID=UPI0012FD3506|nr:hypothetical protein [Rhizobium sullae]